MKARAKNLVALGAGALFAAGLGLSGMTRPAKVEGFLDVTGAWDPSLAFVMVGAIGVYAIAVRVAKRRAAPMFAPAFAWPTAKGIDARLIVGAVLFGLGWGLSGLCPGPALVSVASGAPVTGLFFVVLAATLAVMRRVLARRPWPGGALSRPELADSPPIRKA